MRFRTMALAVLLSCGVTTLAQAARKPVTHHVKAKTAKRGKVVKIKPRKAKSRRHFL